MIRQANGVEDVEFQKDVVDTLLLWTNAIRLVGLSLAGLLAFDSLLIITTVISMKIALKKEEIEILKLVGASPWYIRMPFILEGGLYGAAGAAASWVVVTGLIIWIRPMILVFLGMIPSISLVLGDITDAPFLLAAGGYLVGLSLFGFLLGGLGSLGALGKYLRI